MHGRKAKYTFAELQVYFLMTIYRYSVLSFCVVSKLKEKLMIAIYRPGMVRFVLCGG